MADESEPRRRSVIEGQINLNSILLILALAGGGAWAHRLEAEVAKLSSSREDSAERIIHLEDSVKIMSKQLDSALDGRVRLEELERRIAWLEGKRAVGR